MARSLDEIFPELQRARLAFEQASSPAERARWSNSLDLLRAEARDAAGDPVTHLTDRDLEQRITHLRVQLAELAARKLSTGHVDSGSNSGGMDPRVVVRHNAEVDRTFARGDLERELRALTAERRRRDGRA